MSALERLEKVNDRKNPIFGPTLEKSHLVEIYVRFFSFPLMGKTKLKVFHTLRILEIYI